MGEVKDSKTYIVVVAHRPSGFEFGLRSPEEWERLKNMEPPVGEQFDIAYWVRLGFLVRHPGGAWIVRG